jgi:hypothetical protein
MSSPSIPIITSDTPQVSESSIRFYWRTPTTSGSAPISSYTLFCSSINYSDSFPVPINNVEFSNLTIGTPYISQIFATNSDGFSSPLATYPTLTPGFLPTPPLNQMFSFESN